MNHLVDADDGRSSFSPRFNDRGYKTCPHCEGQQEADEQPCEECEGSGEVPYTDDDEADAELNAAEAAWEAKNDR